MDVGLQNEIWAKKIIDVLINQGITYFCCGPGSRSTPLSLAVANHPQASWTVHFDERGLAFHALGYAKTSKKPAVLIMTSGTAVGNVLPALMEASNERIPLILITADRPPELRDCGANQTIDQVKLFTSVVRWQVDLPCPDTHTSDLYLGSSISHAVLMANYSPAGPVHINCMFREPLFAPQAEKIYSAPAVDLTLSELTPSLKTMELWVEKLATTKRGVILAGSCQHDLNAILSLAKKLKWPIFADILAPLCSEDSEVICHYDPILKIKNSLEIDAVIQFGGRFASKVLTQWLGKQNLEFYLQVSDTPMRNDPTHLLTHRILSSPTAFSLELAALLPSIPDSFWLKEWQNWDRDCSIQLGEFFSADDLLTEPRIIWEIASFLPEDWNLFVANSMPIRDANQFFPRRTSTIFGNRGVSGIDGNIATACGIAQGNHKATMAIIGDMAFLHDLNSLALLAKSEHPIILCVINNGGGGIFSFMPISKRQDAFEEFIATAHAMDFTMAARLFQIPYFHPETASELSEILRCQKEQLTSCIIEMTTDRNTNVSIHEKIISTLGTCLNTAGCAAETPAFLH